MSEPRCPLLVVRKHYDETTDAYTRAVEVCGDVLFLEREESLSLDTDDGEMCATTGPDWKLTCLSGHVILVPDHQADDNYELIPWDTSYLAAALKGGDDA